MLSFYQVSGKAYSSLSMGKEMYLIINYTAFGSFPTFATALFKGMNNRNK
jgi:hypothetical protein